MASKKKEYYTRKNEISLTNQEKLDLIGEIGWFTKDIQKFYRFSYPVALDIFKKVAARYGTLRFDKRQVKTEDVMTYMHTSVIKERTRLTAVLNVQKEQELKAL